MGRERGVVLWRTNAKDGGSKVEGEEGGEDAIVLKKEGGEEDLSSREPSDCVWPCDWSTDSGRCWRCGWKEGETKVSGVSPDEGGEELVEERDIGGNNDVERELWNVKTKEQTIDRNKEGQRVCEFFLFGFFFVLWNDVDVFCEMEMEWNEIK